MAIYMGTGYLRHVCTMVCMWHHVKEEVQIELELQMKKSGDNH